jgi:hypothetical protein
VGVAAPRHVLRYTDAPLINSHRCRLLLLGAGQTVLPASACCGGPKGQLREGEGGGLLLCGQVAGGRVLFWHASACVKHAYMAVGSVRSHLHCGWWCQCQAMWVPHFDLSHLLSSLLTTSTTPPPTTTHTPSHKHTPCSSPLLPPPSAQEAAGEAGEDAGRPC